MKSYWISTCYNHFTIITLTSLGSFLQTYTISKEMLASIDLPLCHCSCGANYPLSPAQTCGVKQPLSPAHTCGADISRIKPHNDHTSEGGTCYNGSWLCRRSKKEDANVSKLIHLTTAQRSVMEEGGWLDDNTIHAAQLVLNRQGIGSVNGLKNPLLLHKSLKASSVICANS